MQRAASIAAISIFLLALGWMREKEVVASESEAQPRMRVFLLPFASMTYSDMTAESIVLGADYEMWFCAGNAFTKRLPALLENEKGSADLNQREIRLKVEMEGVGAHSYLVDKSGRVLRADGSLFMLSSGARNDLEKEIIGYHGVVDKKANIEPWPNIK